MFVHTFKKYTFYNFGNIILYLLLFITDLLFTKLIITISVFRDDAARGL